MLYLVATPIGNLGDISARAIEILRTADVIAAEDTRVTRKLLSHFGIKTPLISYHEHSGPAATEALVRRLAEHGHSVALVTDAGTPAISDPGAHLVAGAINAGVHVTPVPGPAALIAGLVGSGLPSSRFVFEGFLPRTKSSRLKRLDSMKSEERTVIFYESPQRIGATLGEIAVKFGADRRACVCRELTKLFEEFRRGTLGELALFYSAEKTRGECVIVVEGAAQNSNPATVSLQSNAALLWSEGGADIRTTDLIRMLAESIGVPRREVYQMVLDLKKSR